MSRRLSAGLTVFAASVLALVALTPLIGGWLVRGRVLPKIARRIGKPITVEDLWVRWGRVEMRGLKIDGGTALPPVYVPRIRASVAMGALLSGRFEVEDADVESPRIELVRSSSGDDNISAILEALRNKPEGSGGGGGGRRTIVKHARVTGGALAAADERYGSGTIASFEAELTPDELNVELDDAQLELNAGPRANAKQVRVTWHLADGRPDGLPLVEIRSGSLTPLPGLEMSGIFGTLKPDVDPRRAIVDVRGSYGGSDRELWNVKGWVDPHGRSADIKLRCARFRLGQLGAYHAGDIVDARKAEVSGRFDLNVAGDLVKYSGALHLAGLTVAHPMLGPLPVTNIGFDTHSSGTLDTGQHKLHLAEMVVDYKKVHATLTADVENLGPKPKFSAALQVRPLPCQTVLEALPTELTPILQGFAVKGTFSTDLHAAIDFGDLEQPIDLGGKVGIEGCAVKEAPPQVDAQRLLASFLQTVQTEPGKWMAFYAGPENPWWTPYDQISPHLINSIMTTEDNGFFKHHGFIPSEFRSALQQNLQKGYFRLGASSITMQMVKNVLLSREKTLSRKLQELFLTWYLEHSLTKERILEIYFNVIEFGPGIYGIGRAVRHYFGKTPRELEPQEAAFFSSILPSPKRRYVQYCHKDGLLDAKWDAYIKRIMRRNHERGRLTDEEFEKALATPVQFDRTEALPEKECMALVKRLTTPLQPPPGQEHASAK